MISLPIPTYDSKAVNVSLNEWLHEGCHNYLNNILNSSHDGFVLLDNHFKICYWNKSYEKIIKRITGKLPDGHFNLFQFINETADENNIIEKLKLTLAGEIIEYNVKIKSIDTENNWLHIHLYPTKDSLENINGITITIRDITTRRQNEEMLHYNTTLLDNMRGAVISTDLSYNIVSLNLAAESILAINFSEIKGTKIHESLQFQFINFSYEDVLNQINIKGYFDGKLRYTLNQKTNKILSCRITKVIGRDNTPIGYMSILLDITNETLLQELLEQQQEYTTKTFDSSPSGIMMINAKGELLLFNQMAQRMIKNLINNELIVGENILNILPNTRRTDVIAKIALALEGKLIDYEIQYPGKKWLWSSYVPVMNSRNEITEIIIHMRDISEKKELELNLRKNEYQYRSLFHSISEGVIYQTFDKRVITANERAVSILQHPKGEIQQFGFPLPGSILINELNEPLDVKKIIHDKTYLGFSVQNLITGIVKNHETQWLNINIEPVINEEGLPNACVISFRDVTTNMHDKEELNLLSSVLKETSNNVIITNQLGRIIWVNEAFTTTSGYSLSDAMGKSPGHLLGSTDTDKQEITKMVKAIQEGVFIEGEIWNVAKNGEKYLVHYNIHPVKDQHGNVVKFFSIQTDITEKHILQEQLVRQRIEVQKSVTLAQIKGQEKERNEIGRELHDNIQQILAASKLHLDCAINYEENKEDFLHNAYDNVNLAISEVRSFSKQLVSPRFKEKKLVDEIKVQLSNMGLSAKTELITNKFSETKVNDELKLVLFRIIQEQLTNTIKHAKASEIKIVLQTTKELIKLEVSDNGVGFDSTIKKAGIGLENIQNRIELYNGEVRITSSPGNGCKLQAVIPL